MNERAVNAVQPYFATDGISLYHGDCRDIVPALGLTFDCILADPPYGQTSLAWDRWPTGWPRTCAFVSRSLWCFGSLRMFTTHWAEFAAWRLSQDVVWEKHNGSSFHADRFKRVHEQAAHFYRGPWRDSYKAPPTTHDATARATRRKQRPPHMGHINAGSYESFDGGPRLMRSVIYARSMHGSATNETQKPEALISLLMDYGCPAGGLILSPFTGSGTDLLVARWSGRRAVGIELREEQCELAARRLEQTLPLQLR